MFQSFLCFPVLRVSKNSMIESPVLLYAHNVRMITPFDHLLQNSPGESYPSRDAFQILLVVGYKAEYRQRWNSPAACHISKILSPNMCFMIAVLLNRSEHHLHKSIQTHSRSIVQKILRLIL